MAGACAAILLKWFDDGLIAVMTSRDKDALAASDARALLADPAAWSAEHSLVLTNLGKGLLDDLSLA